VSDQTGGRGAAPPPPIPTPDPQYAWPEKPVLLGTAVKRIDAPDKVTGRARYTYDINRPGMLYGRMARSPYPHAKIVSIDLTAAEKAPGVRAVLQWKEPGAEVLYQGDPVAAVAADTEERACDAARLVRVRYEPLPHVSTEAQSMAAGAPKWHTAQENTRPGARQETGDLDAGFKAAGHVVEATYSTHVITHVCLETHGAVCEWEGDRLTAWVTTQGVHQCAQGFAQALGIPEANVRVITQYMGGGFGSKFAPDAQGVICARLARLANAPVKLMLDRREEHLDTGNRPSAFAQVRAGVSSDGKLTAFDAQSWGTGGAGEGANFPLPYLYQFPNRRRAHTDVYINAGQQRAMRAPGHPQGCFITEILMDELADRVKLDPVEFRIRNAPPQAPNAMWIDYFREGARRFGWEKRHPTGDPSPGPIKTGMGVSAHLWGGGGRGTRAHIDITSDGAVVVKCGTQDIGTGTRTIVTVVAAETLGLPITAVKAEIGDTTYPFSGGSGGSTTAASVSPAIRIAAVKARDALFARVAPSIGTPPENLVAEGGRIHVKGNAGKGLAWKDACKHLGTEPVSVDAEWAPGLSSSGTSGVQFAEVTVDIETGLVRIKRILAIQDCGLVVDRLTAESQVHGGIIAAINFALFEDRLLDRVTGQMVNPNMEFYLLAAMSDIPSIEVVLKNMPERGVIGIGEPPTVSTASAIANAVRNATGATIRSLPLHPHKVLAALDEQRAGGTQ
jgi:xanthine dehydrogenase YagR molybdenum-binding subunit